MLSYDIAVTAFWIFGVLSPWTRGWFQRARNKLNGSKTRGIKNSVSPREVSKDENTQPRQGHKTHTNQRENRFLKYDSKIAVCGNQPRYYFSPTHSENYMPLDEYRIAL